MSKHNVSNLMRYRPAYSLMVLYAVIINNKIVRLSTQMLCLGVRTFLVNKERIVVTAIVP